MEWAINTANSIADGAVLTLLKTPGVATTMYKSLFYMLPPVQSSLIKVICIFYNSILYPDSKTQIEQFIQKDTHLKQFYAKYQMFLILCNQETSDPVALFQTHKDTLNMLLPLMGIHMDLNTIDIEKLKLEINTHIGNVISLIQNYKPQIEATLNQIKGLMVSKMKGGTKHNKRSKYGRKSRTRIKRTRTRIRRSRFNTL
jgi:hypothetical protein